MRSLLPRHKRALKTLDLDGVRPSDFPQSHQGFASHAPRPQVLFCAKSDGTLILPGRRRCRHACAPLVYGAVNRRTPTTVRTMSAELAFNRSVEVDYGVAQKVAPDVRRIVANNPGPYTF